MRSARLPVRRPCQERDSGTDPSAPAGLSAFPLRSVDDFPATAPASWLQRGGVVLPMDQSEALWISFSARYPCAVKIAAGKINTVSGAAWTAELQGEPQDYVGVPRQPWLDGFSAGAGLIRHSASEILEPTPPSPRSSASPRKYGVAKSSTSQRGWNQLVVSLAFRF